MNRHGFSCNRCGEWFFTTEPVDARIVCPVCSGQLRYRGQVKRDWRVTFDTEAPVCDDRCTSALGVKCDCKCGGRNHGSGRTVTVSVVAGSARVDLGDTARLEALQAKRLPLIEQAERLTAELVAEFEVIYESVLVGARAGDWLAADRYARVAEWRGHRQAIRHAATLKTPEGRLRALGRVRVALEATGVA